MVPAGSLSASDGVAGVLGWLEVARSEVGAVSGDLGVSPHSPLYIGSGVSSWHGSFSPKAYSNHKHSKRTIPKMQVFFKPLLVSHLLMSQ